MLLRGAKAMAIELPTLNAANPLRLPASPEVDLWLVDLRFQPSPDMQSWLSAAELHRATRFVFERDRRRYLAAHTALRQLLAKYGSVAPRDLQFAEGPFGKPTLGDAVRCAFNLSHSEDDAVISIAAEGEIGVDVEVLRVVPDAIALARRNFSAPENTALAEVDAAGRDFAFLTGWTRKEACLKAIGSGLSIAPETFSAGLAHEACRSMIGTPEGVAEVAVQSFCHEQRLLVAWAQVQAVRRG